MSTTPKSQTFGIPGLDVPPLAQDNPMMIACGGFSHGSNLKKERLTFQNEGSKFTASVRSLGPENGAKEALADPNSALGTQLRLAATALEKSPLYARLSQESGDSKNMPFIFIDEGKPPQVFIASLTEKQNQYDKSYALTLHAQIAPEGSAKGPILTGKDIKSIEQGRFLTRSSCAQPNLSDLALVVD